MAVAAVLVVVKQVAGRGDRGTPATVDARQVEGALLGRRADSLALIAHGDTSEQWVTFGTDGPELVVLFRSDCPACQRVAPIWVALAQSGDAHLKAHAITVEPPETAAPVVGGGIQVWHARSSRAVAETFPSPAVPVTMLLSGGGIIRFARVGPLSAAAVDTLVGYLRGPVD